MIGRQTSSGSDAAIRKRMTEPVDLGLGWPANDQYSLLQPQINAEGIHVWPFDSVLPVDLRFLTSDGQNTVRKNRHDYFEIFLLCRGVATFQVEDRHLPMNVGDMAIVGSTLYHSTESPPCERYQFSLHFFRWPKCVNTVWCKQWLHQCVRPIRWICQVNNRQLGIVIANNWLWNKGRHNFNIGGQFRRTYQDLLACQFCGGTFSLHATHYLHSEYQ